MIPTHNHDINTISSSTLSKSSVGVLQAAASASDALTNLFNKQIEKGIESFVRTFSTQELEFLKYLYYYFKKWGGNIQIPIKNLCERFGLAERWVHNILARLYKAGLLITTKGGYGRKVTRRTFTERALIVIRNLLPPEKISKQVTPRNCADYCADYPRGDTKYISSKGDQLQEKAVSQVEEKPFRSVADCLATMKSMLGIKMNE
jgi:DNA-binding MarR family transcriptional regulator